VGYEDEPGGRIETPLREVKSEPELAVKEELGEPGLTEEAVLDVLDQVDGSKDIGA
jgi:hypothetical protein